MGKEEEGVGLLAKIRGLFVEILGPLLLGAAVMVLLGRDGQEDARLPSLL